MKNTPLLATLLLTSSGLSLQAATARIEDANNGQFVISGPTVIVEGNNAVFPQANPNDRWTVSNGSVSGTDRVAITVASPVNNDFYFNFDAAALGTIPVADNRFVEIHYSTSGDWSGAATSHALRLDTDNEAAEFVSFINRGLIPPGSATGPQSIIVDLDLNGDWSGNWTTLRWDFFNAAGNGGGKSFTIDRLVFGNTLTAVPEPGSLTLLGFCAATLLLRRRRH